MANTEKVYSRVTDAEEIVKKLCEKQPDVLWTVRPETIAVLGIENKERSEKSKVLAKVKPVKGEEKFILFDANIPIRYIITLYWSDWREWKEKQRQWVLLHELLHIHSEIGKTIKHDINDFKIIVAHPQAGVNWFNSDNLPDLVNEDVKFNLELRPSLEDAEEETDNIDDDETSKATKKAKKDKEVKEAKKEKVKDSEEKDLKDEKGEDIFSG